MTPMAWVSLAELCGFLLAAYGLVRQSFSELSSRRPHGEGRFGEGGYGGSPSEPVGLLLKWGVALRLLPRDHELTITDHKRNAALAIVGVTLGAGALAAAFLLSIPVCHS
jgi:hypothetical protein